MINGDSSDYCPEAGDFAVNYAYRYGVSYGMASANHLST